MKLFHAALIVVTAIGATARPPAQQPIWTVKPQWVRAHEEFLASDVLAGRGSATRDELIAATYVASEFLADGLQPAPGMSSYLQTADLTGPVLDGHATLTAGPVHLTEGDGVTLLSSPGTSLSGPLVFVRAADAASAKLSAGAIVVLTELPANASARSAYGVLLAHGAAAIVLPQSPSTERSFQAAGGRTRTPVRLAEQPASHRPSPTLWALDAAHLAQLTAVATGTPTQIQVNALASGTRHTTNAIGYMPGTDPHAGTLLLTAHLDHLGVGRPEDGDAIWNGADDDASGTTAVLELARALSAGPKLRRGVLFVCYGSEEIGELGSTYFALHPPVPLKDLVANLEFEMIGYQDPKMPKGTLLLTGWDRSNLGPTLKAHGALLGPDPYPEEHYFERSDNYALALEGVVAHTAAGWGDPPTYHRPTDDLAHLDLPLMTAAIQSLVEPLRWLAGSDFKPTWNRGGQPKHVD